MEESKPKKMNEKSFVSKFVEVINLRLDNSKHEIIEGKNLFYELTVNRELVLHLGNIEDQIRGKSAFQTGAIVFEKKENRNFPLVVFEFKLNPSTHDIIVYSAKARKHKQIYPWLRYGMFICGIEEVPIKKFLKHNEFLDFCVSVKKMIEEEKINEVEVEKINKFILAEIEIAKSLESICFDNPKKSMYQNRIIFGDLL